MPALRPSPISAILVSALVVLGGCSRIARSEFVAEARQICADSAGPISELARPFLETPAEPPDLGRWAEVLGRLETLRAGTVGRLRALHAPDAVRPVVERWLDAVDRSIETLAPAREAAEHGDREAFRAALASSGRAASRAREIGIRLGLDGCDA